MAQTQETNGQFRKSICPLQDIHDFLNPFLPSLCSNRCCRTSYVRGTGTRGNVKPSKGTTVAQLPAVQPIACIHTHPETGEAYKSERYLWSVVANHAPLAK